MTASPATDPEVADGAHLVPGARALLDRPKEERIRAIRSGSWVPYPRAKYVLEQLVYVLEQPNTPRMTGLTLHGPTNNGKTSIINSFITRMKSSAVDPEAERTEFLYVETPPVPNQSMLFSKILRAVNDPRSDKGTMTQRMDRVLTLLPRMHLRMLFLDEIHNVLAGSSRQSEAFLNTLKHLSNELRIPMVLIGTDDALNVLKTDAQVLNRFPAVGLPQWPAGEEFQRLLTYILSTLPLRKPPRLTAPLVQRIYQTSGGVIGGLVQLLHRAAAYAIQHEHEQIDGRVLDALEGPTAMPRVA